MTPLDPLQVTPEEPDLTDHATRATGVWAVLVVACFAGMGIIVLAALVLRGVR